MAKIETLELFYIPHQQFKIRTAHQRVGVEHHRNK